MAGSAGAGPQAASPRPLLVERGRRPRYECVQRIPLLCRAPQRTWRLGKATNDVKWDAETFVIDWEACGFYQLRPVKPEDASGPHQYKTVFDRRTTCEVPLPGHLMITDSWALEHNYSLVEAGISSPPGVKPKIHKRFIDLFCDDDKSYRATHVPASETMNVSDTSECETPAEDKGDVEDTCMVIVDEAPSSSSTSVGSGSSSSNAVVQPLMAKRTPPMSEKEFKKKIMRLTKAAVRS